MGGGMGGVEENSESMQRFLFYLPYLSCTFLDFIFILQAL